MTISNYDNGKYIKIDSDYIKNIDDYNNVEIGVNINCCGVDDIESIQSTVLQTEDGNWNVDLDSAVKLTSTLRALNLYNIITGQKSNVMTSPIDLGYVEDNCSSDICTLETFASHFIPIFETLLDTFFTSIGLSPDLTITFDENLLKIEGLPDNYILQSAEYGPSEPYTEVIAGYANDYGKAFIANGSLFLTYKFFAGNLSKFRDGIYKITLKYNASNGSWVSESGCAFIDIDTKCKVASFLQNIVAENKTSIQDKPSTIIHVLHYALVNGSNCGCNCNELCEIYSELYSLINDNPKLVNKDCGCQM